MKLAKILKDHNCLVRGGPEQGQRLLDALLVRGRIIECAQPCELMSIASIHMQGGI